MLLTDEVLESLRAKPEGKRRDLGQPLIGCV
jgi:hypothetical protein